MRIADLFAARKFGLSFEVYPPKNEAGRMALDAAVDRLAGYDPIFFSCTYGAGGSTRTQTLEIVTAIQRRHRLPVTAHLTCVGSTVEELIAWLDRAVEAGVPNIMALRGDPPRDQATFIPVAGGLRYAAELVRLIRERFPELGIGVAGYPETHQEAVSPEADLLNLQRKVEAGADAVFCQLFYDNDAFWRFHDRCRALGISVPVIPGILPIVNYAQIQRISKLCKAVIPPALVEHLECCKDDAAGQLAVGVDWATAQCDALIRRGVRGLHFYVLNQSTATDQVLRNLKFSHGGR